MSLKTVQEVIQIREVTSPMMLLCLIFPGKSRKGTHTCTKIGCVKCVNETQLVNTINDKVT